MDKIIKYLNENKSMNFNKVLFKYIDDSNLLDSDVYHRADLDRKLFSKVRCNDNYIPKKKNIIKLCISLRLNYSDTQLLLNSAGYSLSTNNDSDLIVKYCLENNIYNLTVINGYLNTLLGTIL